VKVSAVLVAIYGVFAVMLIVVGVLMRPEKAGIQEVDKRETSISEAPSP